MQLSPTFSTGDLISSAGVVILLLTFLVDKFRHAQTKAAADGSADAAITVRVEGLDQLLKAHMAALGALSIDYQQHKVDDAALHAEFKTEMAGVKGELQGVNRRLDNLNAQISRLTPADTFAEVVPGRRKGIAGA